ncbi:PH domain-containing protein [Ornithinimicrobium ciconiae]|uniref:PH domain-containing protein n=1 Tax=Ornithinimicrobium ciconiae TaxID=2594265 RepID=A0A516G7F5_9MICO|nr:PH domain-containing protein [Ornithinimicrobium ciconiae]QDO87425.1 PH domain-containing protein [Ornithinimicrobium ciconiae]
MRGTRVNSRLLDRYLLEHEEIIVAIRHHWGRMIEPVLTTLAALMLAIWFSANATPHATILPDLLILIFLVLLARLVWKAIEWRNEWFVATDKRLIMTYGLITHKVAMMPLRKVTDMNYSRSLLGRMLGYGQFLMESAGQDQAMREINWVPDPDETYRRICDTIFGPDGQDPDDDIHGFQDPQSPDSQVDYEEHDSEEHDRYEDAAWEVSHDHEPTYAPVGHWDDPDITGPIARPRG